MARTKPTTPAARKPAREAAVGNTTNAGVAKTAFDESNDEMEHFARHLKLKETPLENGQTYAAEDSLLQSYRDPTARRTAPGHLGYPRSRFPDGLKKRTRAAPRALGSIQLPAALLAADGSDEDSGQESHQDSDEERFVADGAWVNEGRMARHISRERKPCC